MISDDRNLILITQVGAFECPVGKIVVAVEGAKVLFTHFKCLHCVINLSNDLSVISRHCKVLLHVKTV